VRHRPPPLTAAHARTHGVRQDTEPCPAGETLCSLWCADLQTDVQNCGSCDIACQGWDASTDSSPTCQAGVCMCGAERACPRHDAPNKFHCPDYETDNYNCGACGLRCPDGQACVGGKCSACPAGQSVCRGQCRDLQNDPDACGSCDTQVSPAVMPLTSARATTRTRNASTGSVSVPRARGSRAAGGASCSASTP
jgi:hypothetical protein